MTKQFNLRPFESRKSNNSTSLPSQRRTKRSLSQKGSKQPTERVTNLSSRKPRQRRKRASAYSLGRKSPTTSFESLPQRSRVQSSPDITKRVARRRQRREALLETAALRNSQPRKATPKKTRRKVKRPPSPLIYILRLLILGIGLAAIVGTIISTVNPARQVTAESAARQTEQSAENASSKVTVSLGQEIVALKTEIEALTKANSQLDTGVFFIDLDTGNYLDLQGNKTFAAASTIKVPVLVAFFQDVDAGKINLNDTLTLEAGDLGDGSGDLQYQQLGTTYTALEVATKMIEISDNTATNMIIRHLGGKEALNSRFRSWGLTATVINNPLPDIEGTNTTNPQELANLMAVINRGQLVSMKSGDRILDIMEMTANDSLLPQGLEPGATIAHKTGNIGSLVADVGQVDMPSGKRYIASVMVKRPRNDSSAQQLIQEISRVAYEHFNQPTAQPDVTTSPRRTSGSVARN